VENKKIVALISPVSRCRHEYVVRRDVLSIVLVKAINIDDPE
jgi:hypothetical protein